MSSVTSPPVKPTLTKEQIESIIQQILNRFKSAFIEFVDGLIGTYPSEKTFIIIRIILNDELPALKIMDRYIKDIYPHKDLIKKRDDNFFLDSGSLESFNKDRIFQLRKIWINTKMTAIEKEKIFKHFDLFNEAVKKYLQYTNKLDQLNK